MTWQARGGGGGPVFRGGGVGGGGGGAGGYLTPTTTKLLAVAVVSFFVSLLMAQRLGLGWLIEQMVLFPVWVEGWRPWQLLTYPFFGLWSGEDSFQLLTTLMVLFFFTASVERYFGTGRFYSFLAAITVIPAAIGMVIAPFLTSPFPFFGLSSLSASLICAFGWLYSNQEIRLNFILPIPAIWLVYITIGVEIALIIGRNPMGVYNLLAIGVTYAVVQRGVRLPDARRKWLEMKEKRLKRRLKKFDVIQGGGKKKSSNGAPDEPKEWLH